MKAVSVLLLGLAVGVATHLAYYRLHREPQAGSLDGELAWMKADLHLSDAQFARIRELHEASSPRLQALGAEVAQMQAEFAGFENTRRASDRIDFIEFARFVQLRREIDRQCRESTRALVLASSSEMTPVQRQRYFGILAPTGSLGRLTN